MECETMQQLKLKRLKKKKDMPERRTTYCHGFILNDDYITFTIEITDKVYITNESNGKVYQLINEKSKLKQ